MLACPVGVCPTCLPFSSCYLSLVLFLVVSLSILIIRKENIITKSSLK